MMPSFHQKLASGEYNTRLQWTFSDETNCLETRQLWAKDVFRLEKQFKHDLMVEFCLDENDVDLNEIYVMAYQLAFDSTATKSPIRSSYFPVYVMFKKLLGLACLEAFLRNLNT